MNVDNVVVHSHRDNTLLMKCWIHSCH